MSFAGASNPPFCGLCGFGGQFKSLLLRNEMKEKFSPFLFIAVNAVFSAGTAIFVFIDFWVPLGTLFLFSYFTWFSCYRVSQTGKTYPHPVLHHADNEV